MNFLVTKTAGRKAVGITRLQRAVGCMHACEEIVEEMRPLDGWGYHNLLKYFSVMALCVMCTIHWVSLPSI